ncbi:hypothetical protein [Periweissella fabaria]|uniref:Prepilin type IV endopeptidase peptidase domain-containing protein n=1 Tax=Periweissella fabaria TaxID=546157 RepID=A0ABM8Z5M8_9LACO|nr:hypothetical protein [Periweissella fabaria]CAH0416618.1 hypothetical protein WFA24289_00922 [Periweissella fabaria]
MQTIYFIIVVTAISYWALWDSIATLPNHSISHTNCPHLISEPPAYWLSIALILGSNSLMLLLKNHFHSYLITLISLSILVLFIQDLLTAYVNVIFAWIILVFVIVLNLPILTLTSINITLCLALILLICIDWAILGSGDFPVILMLQLVLPPPTFSYLLILAATFTSGWLLLSNQRAVPFIPSLAGAYWCLLLLNLI